jgi:hypothetical protein
LTKAIASKAPKEDLERIAGLKADKSETENLMDSIHTLNSQLRHVIVLMSETVKLQLSGTTTKNNYDQQVINLMRQV